MENKKEMGYSEKECNKLGVELLSIEKLGGLARFFSNKQYKIIFKYKDEVFKLNVFWSNRIPEKEDIFYYIKEYVEEMVREREKMSKQKEFNDFIEEVNGRDKNGN